MSYRTLAKLAIFLMALAASPCFARAQTIGAHESQTAARYLNQFSDISADHAVRIALQNNGELQALRKELDAARALIKQARLHANPSLEANGTKQITGQDNSLMTQAILPL